MIPPRVATVLRSAFRAGTLVLAEVIEQPEAYPGFALKCVFSDRVAAAQFAQRWSSRVWFPLLVKPTILGEWSVAVPCRVPFALCGDALFFPGNSLADLQAAARDLAA